jgi:hypothetical protein
MEIALSRIILFLHFIQTHHPLGLLSTWVHLEVSSQCSFLLESRVAAMIMSQSDISSVLGRHLPPVLSVIKQIEILNLCGSVAVMESLDQRYLFIKNHPDIYM